VPVAEIPWPAARQLLKKKLSYDDESGRMNESVIESPRELEVTVTPVDIRPQQRSSSPSLLERRRWSYTMGGDEEM
jgi:hypothetical protein